LFLIGCVKVPYERLLLATKRESMRLYIYGLSVGLNLVLNVLLIPAWAAYGAVWASIISEVFLAVKLHGLCTGIVRARYRTMGGGLLGAGAVAAGVGMLMRGVIAWPVLVGVTLAVFLGASVAFRILTVEDQRRLIGALHNASAKTLPG
jgi:O-antigen/teichoic acid export membrane protein